MRPVTVGASPVAPNLPGCSFSISGGEDLTAHRPPAVRLREAMSYSRPRFYPLDPRTLSLCACVSLLAGAPPAVKSRQLYRQPVNPAVSMDILSLTP